MYDGVSIFFTLSGFLIGGILIKILEKEQKLNTQILWNFWKRRWLRTLPNYFLILSILVIYFLLFRDFEGIAYWKYFFFIQNLGTPQPWFFGESWSLSIEEWFYLITPIGLLICIKYLKLKLKHSMILVASTLIFLSLWARVGQYAASYPFPMDLTRYGSLIRMQIQTRLDGLMIGVLAACLQFYKPIFWKQKQKLMFLVGLIFLIIYYFFKDQVLPMSWGVASPLVIALGVALILPYLNDIKHGKGVLFKIITYISLTSYSAYLINLALVQDIVVYNLSKLLPGHWPLGILSFVQLILFFTLTFGGAILLYKYFELPIMKLRDKKK
jgi:peptidoglycan/LPS O-acetylase OafA/YrhL